MICSHGNGVRFCLIDSSWAFNKRVFSSSGIPSPLSIKLPGVVKKGEEKITGNTGYTGLYATRDGNTIAE